jgi:hypothetical protein
MILLNLWALADDGSAPPLCLVGEPERVDLNCDQSLSVADVIVSIERALNAPPSGATDADLDGCPDACEPQN